MDARAVRPAALFPERISAQRQTIDLIHKINNAALSGRPRISAPLQPWNCHTIIYSAYYINSLCPDFNAAHVTAANPSSKKLIEPFQCRNGESSLNEFCVRGTNEMASAHRATGEIMHTIGCGWPSAPLSPSVWPASSRKMLHRPAGRLSALARRPRTARMSAPLPQPQSTLTASRLDFARRLNPRGRSACEAQKARQITSGKNRENPSRGIGEGFLANSIGRKSK
jgi:hypothetical protein